MMTQIEVENIAIVKRGFEAFKAHDMATLAELFAENVEWSGAATGVLAGSYSGRKALFDSFRQLGEETAGTFRSTPVSMAGAADEVFVSSQVTGERKGRKLDTDEVVVFKLQDGRVRQVHMFQGDPAALEAFWS